MRISIDSKIIFFYYILTMIWGVSFYFLQIKETSANYWYQFAFGLIPLLGGVCGITKSREWGWFKSKVGVAVFFISLGAFSWGIGQMFWSLYYNIIKQVEVPYPSFADIGYSLSFPFLAIGLISLSKATGARFSFRHPKGKLLALFIAIIATIVAYYLLIVVARGGVIDFAEGWLKLFFDLAYPLGDLIILLFALLIYGLSFNYLGGRYKFPIISMLFGLLVLFVGDFSFSYTTTIGSYYNGHWVDIVLPTAWMMIVFGINSFDTKN